MIYLLLAIIVLFIVPYYAAYVVCGWLGVIALWGILKVWQVARLSNE